MRHARPRIYICMDNLINKLSSRQQPYVRLNPLNDILFCKVMGEKGSEIQLLGFLNSVLGRKGNDKIASVDILENKALSADLIGDKSSILDLRAILQGGTRLNIEVQLRNKRNMNKRSLFYWSKEFSKNLKSGHDYSELPSVITINILNFEYLDTKNFHTVFHLHEDKEHSLILTDALEIHFLNMVKWRKTVNKSFKNDPLQRWLTWFDKSSPVELIEEVVRMDSAILEAEKRQAYLSADEDVIRAYEMREMALSDQVSMENYAREQGHAEGFAEGKAEGIVEGKAEGRLETARKLKALGVPIEKIAAATGLSRETIENLK